MKVEIRNGHNKYGRRDRGASERSGDMTGASRLDRSDQWSVRGLS